MTATVSASVAGSWINGAAVVTGGANHQVINPATGDVVAELALATPGRRRHRGGIGPHGAAGLGERDPGRPRDGAGQAGGADVRTRRRARRRGGQPDRQARAAGRGSSTCRAASTTSTSSPAPRATSRARPPRSTPATTPRASGARPSGSSRPSRRGTTRCRWRCGRCCPRWPPGAAVVIKPAELTPLTTLTLARLATEAGLPDGVFNVVTGAGGDVGTALAGHPRRRRGDVHRVDRRSAAR